MVFCLQVLVTEVEQEEEYLVNNLQKRMDKLHLEKQELEKTLEQQRRKVSLDCPLPPQLHCLGHRGLSQPHQCAERCMRHAAQVEELRLEQVKMSREKEVIENQLEAEQEYIVNKLQKQAMGLAAEKQALQGEKADLKRQVQTSAQQHRR